MDPQALLRGRCAIGAENRAASKIASADFMSFISPALLGSIM
jgi:hypothetical protein